MNKKLNVKSEHLLDLANRIHASVGDLVLTNNIGCKKDVSIAESSISDCLESVMFASLCDVAAGEAKPTDANGFITTPTNIPMFDFVGFNYIKSTDGLSYVYTLNTSHAVQMISVKDNKEIFNHCAYIHIRQEECDLYKDTYKFERLDNGLINTAFRGMLNSVSDELPERIFKHIANVITSLMVGYDKNPPEGEGNVALVYDGGCYSHVSNVSLFIRRRMGQVFLAISCHINSIGSLMINSTDHSCHQHVFIKRPYIVMSPIYDELSRKMMRDMLDKRVKKSRR